MEHLRSAVVSHPIRWFCAWFFTVGQMMAFTPVFTGWPAEPFVVTSTWLGLVLPVVTISWLRDGSRGWRMLLATVTRRVPVRWLVFAVVPVPAVTLGVHLLAEGMPRAGATAWVEAVGLGLAVQCAVVLVTVNLGEELAWTGLVQATLQERGWSSRRAVVAVTPLFALEHIALGVGEGPMQAVAFLLLVTGLSLPFRALQAWVWNRTGSVLVAGLVHASGNAAAIGSIAGAGMVPRLYDEPGQSALAFATVGLVVTVATLTRLGDDRGAQVPDATVPVAA